VVLALNDGVLEGGTYQGTLYRKRDRLEDISPD
jgi:hypothetical protein